MKNDGAFTVAWVDDSLLKFVATLKSARITGSFARLCPADASDLDLRVNEADLRDLKRHLRLRGVEWESRGPGHIVVDGFEFYTDFNRLSKQDRAEFVTINGTRFKTW